jgi:hypothetical protein
MQAVFYFVLGFVLGVTTPGDLVYLRVGLCVGPSSGVAASPASRR